jgi:hypothetical protein
MNDLKDGSRMMPGASTGSLSPRGESCAEGGIPAFASRISLLRAAPTALDAPLLGPS